MHSSLNRSLEVEGERVRVGCEGVWGWVNKKSLQPFRKLQVFYVTSSIGKRRISFSWRNRRLLGVRYQAPLLNRSNHGGRSLTTEKWEKRLVGAAAGNGSPASIHFALARQIEKSATRTGDRSHVLAHAIGFTARRVSWTSTRASRSHI